MYFRDGSLQQVGLQRSGVGNSHKFRKQDLGVWRTRSFSLREHGLTNGELCGSAEELKEAGLAVRLAGALLEGALGEGAQAEGASEVIRVEAAAQGRDAAASHWEATRGAQRAAPRMEMVFA